MKPPTRILFCLLGVVIFTYVIERFPACWHFAQLRQNAQLYDWSAPEWVPEKYAPWIPFVFPRAIALQSKPADPKAFTSALRSLRNVSTIGHYSAEDMGTDVYKALGSLRGVQTLTLHYLPSDAAFLCFTQFDSVEELTLFESNVTDLSLPHLEKFQKATKLEVILTGVSTSVATSVLKLPRLTDFYYAHSASGTSGSRSDFSTQPAAMLRAARPGMSLSWE
jgi:hypothetical protein